MVIAGQMPDWLAARLTDGIAVAQIAHPAVPGIRRPRLIHGSSNAFSVAAGAAADPISRSFDPRFSAMMKSVD